MIWGWHVQSRAGVYWRVSQCVDTMLELFSGISTKFHLLFTIFSIDCRWSKCNSNRQAWIIWESTGNSRRKLLNSRVWLWRKWWILDSKSFYCQNRKTVTCFWNVYCSVTNQRRHNILVIVLYTVILIILQGYD